MFIFIDPQKMFRYNIMAMFVVPGAIWFLTANPIFSLAALVATYVLPKYYVRAMRIKRFKTLEKQLPDALLMIPGVRPRIEQMWGRDLLLRLTDG